MACTFFNVKIVSAFIVKEISAVVIRKGFATAAQGVASRNGATTVMLKKVFEESSKSTWMPDPVTGNYRPEKQVKEMDPADRREMFVNNKNAGH